MNLADNLKKIRKEHNLSQEQLAEKLNVSRQSVSKWESNQAYPEMDKMVQLCKLFNLNMDDLLNQDISEVNNNKQAKNSINKFIDDFLKYVTKTIDLFSNMKFKTKIKCLFEQCVIIGILILIIGGCLYSIYVEKQFMPEEGATPAIKLNDGIDFLPMSKYRNALIHFLNIAGMGPIIGAIQGILFGPIDRKSVV